MPNAVDWIHSRTFAYATYNLLAPVVDDRLPAPGDYQSTRCEAISASRITFFLDERPDFDKAVMLLGEQARAVALLVKIVDYRLSSSHGKTWYPVIADFVQRLEPAQLPTGEENAAVGA